jgi:membrane protein required for colicin V production
MIETNLNLFDVIVLAILALSALLAFFRGFVREILSLGAWIGAAIVTLYFFPQVATELQPKFKNAVVAAGFATLGIYVAALLAFSLINMLILKFVKAGSDVGLLDNTLGLFYGVFRGAFLISLGFFLMTIVLPEDEYPVWIKKAHSLPYVKKGAVFLAHVSPKYLSEISSLSVEVKEKYGDKTPKEQAKDAANNFDERMRESIERMKEDHNDK